MGKIWSRKAEIIKSYSIIMKKKKKEEKLLKHYFWLRSKILLTHVNPNGNIFQKISHVLSNFSSFLNHEIMFHPLMLKNMCKANDVNVLFKRNWARKAGHSNNFWWNLKQFGVFTLCSNFLDTQLAILICKSFKQWRF